MLIVDGYNVLRSGSRYRFDNDDDFTDDAFNHAREKLLSDVAAFAGHEYKAVIVFDGGGNEYSTGDPETIGGIKVMFSPKGQNADRVIERLAHDAREREIETLVITSDATIQDTVFGGGVDRMSANGFSLEVDQLHFDGEIEAKQQTARKNTVAGRIDAETLRKLVELRDAPRSH